MIELWRVEVSVEATTVDEACRELAGRTIDELLAEPSSSPELVAIADDARYLDRIASFDGEYATMLHSRPEWRYTVSGMSEDSAVLWMNVRRRARARAPLGQPRAADWCDDMDIAHCDVLPWSTVR